MIFKVKLRTLEVALLFVDTSIFFFSFVSQSSSITLGVFILTVLYTVLYLPPIPCVEDIQSSSS